MTVGVRRRGSSSSRRQPRDGALKQLLDETGRDYWEGKKSFVLACPQCEHEDKLYLRYTDGRYVCWFCKDRTPGSFEGYAEKLFAQLLGCPQADIEVVLYGHAYHRAADGGPLQPTFDERYSFDSAAAGAWPAVDIVGDPNFLPAEEGNTAVVVKPKPVGMLWPPDAYPVDSRQGRRGLLYLESRGIGVDVAREYGLRYQPSTARVLFPVVTDGVLVGWQGRTTGPSEWVETLEDGTEELRRIPKILTTMTPNTRDHVLMFEPRIVGDWAVLVEGPVDALKCHLCGGNVASMGKGVSDGQLQRLLDLGVRRLYLGLDPDATVETRTLVRCYHEDFPGGIYYMTPLGTGYEDFGAMPQELALECFRRAPKVGPEYIFLPWARRQPDADVGGA